MTGLHSVVSTPKPHDFGEWLQVRADMQAQEKRNTWLDPDGGVCSNEERNLFQLLMARADDYSEWSWEHGAVTNEECDRGFFTVPTGIHKRQGTFDVPIRPAVVSTWLVQKLHAYREENYIPSSPVHARLMSQLSQFTNNIAVMLTIDRTPLPFPYVQMAASLMLIFCLSLPFALTPIFGAGSPVAAFVFSMAYGGLYINACNLRNPFNYETGITGAPINAYIQRLEVVTEGLLYAVNGEYEMAPESAARKKQAGSPRRDEVSNVDLSEIDLDEMNRPLTTIVGGPRLVDSDSSDRIPSEIRRSSMHSPWQTRQEKSRNSSLYTSRDTDISFEDDLSVGTGTSVAKFPLHGLLRRQPTNTPAPETTHNKLVRTCSLDSGTAEHESAGDSAGFERVRPSPPERATLHAHPPVPLEVTSEPCRAHSEGENGEAGASPARLTTKSRSSVQLGAL
eukprot:TRINITY_DN12520_c0_g1_i4.p1 TRINITY_DN12520_c0_g1~~TRINITY_DN12520_c0_g1_i4.p1  ORF type:complete len:451 (-),score=75.35 TRINITY_DN12520_c0_g1_i4:33-1385(-)